jgi:predicted phosphate transport protein (TIGR00153 family)
MEEDDLVANPLAWFEKRGRYKTLEIAGQHIHLALSTVDDLGTALRAFSDGRSSDMEEAIRCLFTKEEEVDRLRRATLEELARSRLTTAYREDLGQLVRSLDEFADEIKDAARCLKVLDGAKLPREIMDQLLSVYKDLAEGARVLRECIEALSTNPSDVRVKSERLYRLESQIDDARSYTETLFQKAGRQLEPGILAIVHDFLGFVEQAGHACAHTADHLRVIAASTLS